MQSKILCNFGNKGGFNVIFLGDGGSVHPSTLGAPDGRRFDRQHRKQVQDQCK